VQGDRWSLYLFDYQFYFTPTSLGRVVRDAGFEDFRLLKLNRIYPSIRLGSIIRRPMYSLCSWVQWMWAKAKWPPHGDINVMVGVARKPVV